MPANAVSDASSSPFARPGGRREPLQRLLLGGVSGRGLARARPAALGHDEGPADPGYDAVWILLAAVASALAHGYAHAIAHRLPAGTKATAETVRSVLTEWPLVVAVLPTVALLLGAYFGWWSENVGIDIALILNLVALFGWGFWSARVAERGPLAACRVGCVDVLLGLLIIVANTLSK